MYLRLQCTSSNAVILAYLGFVGYSTVFYERPKPNQPRRLLFSSSCGGAGAGAAGAV